MTALALLGAMLAFALLGSSSARAAQATPPGAGAGQVSRGDVPSARPSGQPVGQTPPTTTVTEDGARIELIPPTSATAPPSDPSSAAPDSAAPDSASPDSASPDSASSGSIGAEALPVAGHPTFQRGVTSPSSVATPTTRTSPISAQAGTQAHSNDATHRAAARGAADTAAGATGGMPGSSGPAGGSNVGEVVWWLIAAATLFAASFLIASRSRARLSLRRVFRRRALGSAERS